MKRRMEKEFIITRTGQNMWVTGSKTYKMDLALRSGRTNHDMKASTVKARNKDMDFTVGVMVVLIWETGSIIVYQGMDFILGSMAESTRESG